MTQRICAAAFVAMCGSSLSAWAQTPTPRSGVRESPLSGAGLAVGRGGTSAGHNSPAPAIALLRKRVESVDWSDTPFEEVINWLEGEGEGRVNVIPRWTPLGIEGVDVDTPVTLRLKDTTIAEVLNEALDQLSEDGEVQYRASGRTLKMSTRTDFGRKLQARVYQVIDLMHRVPNYGDKAPRIDLQQAATRGGGGGGGGGGQSIFTGGGGGGGGRQQGGDQEEKEVLERLEELRDLITYAIAPETWDAAGGRGRIVVWEQPAALVVVNTIEVHEMIAGAFSLLEAFTVW